VKGGGFGLVSIICVVTVAVVAAATPGCSGRGDGAVVHVAAASDLRFALADLSAAFRSAHPDVALDISYGSSGAFYAQLLNHAPYDLFLSADVEYPRQLAQRGLTVPNSEFTYAYGRLALWTRASSAVDVTTAGLNALADERIAHVAIANPEHAPYGRAAVSALRARGLYDRVAPKLVFGETVSQALQFVQSGAADAGIVALSLARSPAGERESRVAAIADDLYPRIEQGGAILGWAVRPEAARLFRAFLLGRDARVILERYGFRLPEA